MGKEGEDNANEEVEERDKKKRHSSLTDVTKRFESEISKEHPSRAILNTVFNELYTLATKDQLTGVLNRRSFEELLGREVLRAIEHNLPLSVIMIDIDHFKQYNDTYGHLQGDVALKTVTRVVESNSRTEDFVARYGGEEFIVVLPGIKIDKAVEIAEKMRKSVADTKITASSKDIPEGFEKATISLGVASLGKEGIKDMLERADKALYEAKREGRNKIKVSK